VRKTGKTINRYMFYAWMVIVYLMIMFGSSRDFHLNLADIKVIVIIVLGISLLEFCEWAVKKYIKKRRP
jgi:hypothetical protein